MTFTDPVVPVPHPDDDISLEELSGHFGGTVPEVAFSFLKSTRNADLTLSERRSIIRFLGIAYRQGLSAGREIVGADEAERRLYQQLDVLAERIRTLEENA